MKMMHKSSLLLVFIFSLLLQKSFAQYPAGSPVAINGRLKVIGNKLSNECGNVVALRGVSSHGIQWFPNCTKDNALKELTDNWGIDIYRLAMYVEEGGYVKNPVYWKGYIDTWVDKCGALGIYCLIDWHVLNPGDPNDNLDAAKDFWTYMAAKHGSKKHVLFEICNEPNGVDWNTVKTYANSVIPNIRTTAPSTIVIVGTPSHSQDVDKAASSPLQYDNIMYALHFYSGSHYTTLMKKGDVALSKGIALFITECGTSDASGGGGTFFEAFIDWIAWMKKNNLSWIVWSFADKNESSALLAPGACGTGKFNNLSESGKFIQSNILSPADNFVACNQAPKISLISPAADTAIMNPSDIDLKAVVTDPNGNISKVDFYDGATLVHTINAPSDAYEYTWTSTSAGVHTLKAVVTDEKGAFSAALRTVTVNGVDGLFPISAIRGKAENLFPNPSNGSFNFKITEPVKTLEVVNLYGEVVDKMESLNQGQQVELGSEYSNGTYMMHVQYESGLPQTYRMVKLK